MKPIDPEGGPHATNCNGRVAVRNDRLGERHGARLGGQQRTIEPALPNQRVRYTRTPKNPVAGGAKRQVAGEAKRRLARVTNQLTHLLENRARGLIVNNLLR